MRRVIPYLLFAALPLVGCSDGDQPAPVPSHGTLVLQDIAFQQYGTVLVGTRAVDADLEIDIRRPDGTQVSHFAAGASDLERRVELEPGGYMLVAYTPNYDTQYSGTQAGTPKYFGSCSFDIEEEKVTYCSLDVPLVNVGVKLTLPEGFGTWFSSYTFMVMLGERTVALERDNTVWLDIPDGGGEATCILSATNADGEHMNNRTVFTVEAGHVYDVTYDMSTRAYIIKE